MLKKSSCIHIWLNLSGEQVLSSPSSRVADTVGVDIMTCNKSELVMKAPESSILLQLRRNQLATWKNEKNKFVPIRPW
ncbi:unnamed protein product [Amoebophrya sp. A25]|nr:unnamed protein product [Amoebophrya sp. A25]|eukprot:GSA25T00013420001.1